MNESITKTEYSDDYIETTFGIIFARECQQCKGAFFDIDDNFQYCPFCGRKIDE